MSRRTTSTPTKQKHQTIIENTTDGWMKIGRAGKKAVVEKLSPIKAVKDSTVKDSTVKDDTVSDDNVSDDNVTVVGGIKRAMSGKHWTSVSLLTQTSITRLIFEFAPKPFVFYNFDNFVFFSYLHLFFFVFCIFY